MKKPKAQVIYEAALEAERLRERQWRQTRQGEFESSMLSLDMLPADTTQDTYESWICDHGQGAAAIRTFSSELEGACPLALVISEKKNEKIKLDSKENHRAYKKAHKRVSRKAPHCLKVFNLIIKNGNKREKSICELAKTSQEEDN